MKKIISTILLLTIVICTNACRSQEEEVENQTAEKETSNNIFKKTTDSIKTDSVQSVTNTLPTDPPPKNGHQW